jgi:tetratricopeptide (TPR) repeat protein
LEQAEQAYRQSLAISVQRQNCLGEAGSLVELGLLYDRMGRMEEAATFHRQAADIFARLQDQRNEGRARSNLAGSLIEIQRYDEARRELRRAIECDKFFGHAAEPWKTWGILHDLEQVTGNEQAAAAARDQAIGSYLAYRRAGGESQSLIAGLYALALKAIQRGETTEAAQALAEGWSDSDIYTLIQTRLAKIQAILRGDRDLALAADPNLDYCNAAEMQLLLEALETK